ncbi:MAG: hypothetical protein ACTSQY_00065 [Candidatus Odinarchaeia archaeon]|nr:MAG: hypothetical protein [Lokiarchaeota virus Fenrir Meg22_1012]URC17192.1 MAG: hypothetical protein [Lokiarchaeota virus Fenrir Meg22_1214]
MSDPFADYTSYSGRSGLYWDKSKCVTTTRGEYLLDESYDCFFGEPAVRVGTGTSETPIMKRTVRSYKGTAGASGVLGVFIDYKRDISNYTAGDFALYGGHHNNRDVLIVLRGPVKVKNVGSTYIYATQTVIPADGGCEKMTDKTQKSLGKALQDIPAGEYGLVFVDPEYEKENF